MISDVDQGQEAAAAPLTRAQRRELRSTATPSVPQPATVVRTPMLLASGVVAGLFALSAYAEPTLLAAAFAWACLVMAWAWPSTMNVTPGYVVALPVGLAGVLAATAVALTDTPPYLTLAPVALAIAAVLAFLLQLTRRDGRAGLTASLAASAFGLAFVVLGVCVLPISHAPLGWQVIAAAMAGLVLSLLSDLLLPRSVIRAWLLPLAMVLGVAGGSAVAALNGHLDLTVGALLGLASGAIAYIMRRLLGATEHSAGSKSQIGIGCASVLASGVLIHVIGSIFVG